MEFGAIYLLGFLGLVLIALMILAAVLIGVLRLVSRHAHRSLLESVRIRRPQFTTRDLP